ncbi:MAG: hypothetical protein R3C49_23680 [Planctomycetaceae bacterium]
MKAVYIGILSHGTTSARRAETLRQLLAKADWNLIDTDAAFIRYPRWARTIAFRLRSGPAVRAINSLILEKLDDHHYDLGLVDKGVYLWPETVRAIRSRCRKLVYFTPDTSFYANQSRFFESTASIYDRVVTTKSFDMSRLTHLVSGDKVMLVTQSFDVELHQPRCRFDEKRKEAVLIGLVNRTGKHAFTHFWMQAFPSELWRAGLEQVPETKELPAGPV